MQYWTVTPATLTAYNLICSNPSKEGQISTHLCCSLSFLCSFLYDPNSQGYRYYRQKLEEFRKAKEGSAGALPAPAPNPSLRRKSAPETLSGAVPPNTACPTPVAPAPAINPTLSIPGKPNTSATVKRKRKSRWGPEEDKVELPPAELAQRDIDAAPSPLSGGPPCLVVLGVISDPGPRFHSCDWMLWAICL